ncbi:MAG: type II toxin-antitoxin system YafQ family toxin [Candidatus Margulisbacteria bacterium]|nr:type II toxin-antitoxin system YafQ family toxin [Candidatus Margulisiibacteriota bacterium]
MRKAVYSSQFQKDYKLCQRRGCKIQKLINVMLDLEKEIPLSAKYRPHPLQGNYSGYMDCHIAPDWLLIYSIDEKTKEIYFARTGTHSDLFR